MLPVKAINIASQLMNAAGQVNDHDHNKLEWGQVTIAISIMALHH